MRRAFTVVELLVAVVVLLAVIIATSKIFNTASKVASTGEATADVLQQGSVLEEQLRRDLNAICRDGYMAIQCVAVRNDVNQVISPLANAPLLNPQLPADAVIRCDQLVFFSAGTEISARWAGPGDLVSSGGGQQARAARIYYGHGVQFPGLVNDPLSNPPGSPGPDPTSWSRPLVAGVTPTPSSPAGARLVPVTPWTWFQPDAYRLAWRFSGSTQANGGPRLSANQPECRQWVLARKAVLLADDGGSSLYYPEPTNLGVALSIGPSSVPSVFGDRSYTAPAGADARWLYQELRDRNRVPSSANLFPSPTLQSGWTDIAASDLDKIRRTIAPTLRLQSPVRIGTQPILPSISVPWFIPQNGAPPLSWPTATAGDPSWPGSSPTVVVGANADAGAVGAFTTQRDRIMRGTFGTPSIGNLPTTGILPGLLGWPRTERSIANVDRKTELLTSATLLNNCSSFQVDWTWEPLTGRHFDNTDLLSNSSGTPASQQTDRERAARPALVCQNLIVGGPPAYGITKGPQAYLRGYEPFASASEVWTSDADEPESLVRSQPWFGFPDGYSDVGFAGVPQSQRLGVDLAQSARSMPLVQQAGSGVAPVTNLHMRLVAQSIEGIDGVDPLTRPAAVTAPFSTAVPVRVYTAIFGFNQDEAYTVTPDGYRVIRDDYTPLPTQLRVTCTLHDSRVVLDRGREFQFVLDVPKRRKD